MMIYVESIGAAEFPAGVTKGVLADEKYPEWAQRVIQHAKENLTIGKQRSNVVVAWSGTDAVQRLRIGNSSSREFSRGQISPPPQGSRVAEPIQSFDPSEASCRCIRSSHQTAFEPKERIRCRNPTPSFSYQMAGVRLPRSPRSGVEPR